MGVYYIGIIFPHSLLATSKETFVKLLVGFFGPEP